MLAAGGRHVFLAAYSPRGALNAAATHGATAAIAVPAMVADWARLAPPTAAPAAGRSESQQAHRALPSMRMLLVGAGLLPAADVPPLRALMPHARILTSYGMTETASSVAFDQVHAGAGPAAAPAISPDRRSRSAEPRALAGSPESAPAAGACVGRAAPGIQIAVASEGGAEVRHSAMRSFIAEAISWETARLRKPHVRRSVRSGLRRLRT